MLLDLANVVLTSAWQRNRTAMAASTACATPGRLAVQRPSFRHATRRELQRGQQQHRLTVAKASAEVSVSSA